MLLLMSMSVLVAHAAAQPRMRPYTGIGLVAFAPAESGETGLELPLYDEPGLSRVGILQSSRLPGNQWVFGGLEAPLVVSARKGEWLRIYHDDAGREAWIEPHERGRFITWEQFLKQRGGRMLPGLQPQFYQVLDQPGGTQCATLSAKQFFKVLKTEDAWSQVLIDQAQLGWVRWRDDDGRLLVGTGNK